MITKLIAAEIAIEAGCHTIIANGKGFRPLAQGTPKQHGSKPIRRRTGKQAWIACALKTTGAVVVDNGACNALANGKSLLPVGI